MAAWSIGVASLLLSGCLGGGSCSAAAAAAFNAIDHYGDEELVPEDHPNGGCADTLVTDDEPDAVIEHYRSAFERAGYVVDEIEPVPMVDESEDVIGRTVGLEATSASMRAAVSAEVFEGQDTTFVIFVNERSDD
jgi:hypothetical protein